jgi:hypothetical protein
VTECLALLDNAGKRPLFGRVQVGPASSGLRIEARDFWAFVFDVFCHLGHGDRAASEVVVWLLHTAQ